MAKTVNKHKSSSEVLANRNDKSKNLIRVTSDNLANIFNLGLKRGNIIIIDGLKYRFNGDDMFFIDKNAKKSADIQGKKYKEVIKLYKSAEEQKFTKHSERNYEDKYDRCLYGEYGSGVIFVEKDGLYGVINKEGEELVPCRYAEYSDARHEWADMGFATKKTKVITPEQKTIEEQKLILDTIRKELINEGHINRLELYDDRAVLGAASVKLPNGGIGIAVSNFMYDNERGKNLEIFDENGKHLTYISEPELLKGVGTPGIVISSDKENLYVGTYNTEYSYVAAYKMGTFETKWKVPMYGSRIQSIAVNDSEVVVFDMESGKIKYLDKVNGAQKKGKDMNVGRSHINLASMRIAAIPELEAGVDKGMYDFCDKLQIFDDRLAKRLVGASLSNIIKSSYPIAVDEKNGRVYMAIENMIGIFDTTGCIGVIPETTRNINELDFDSQTNCLLVSMLEGKGKVEALDEEAINEFIKKSNWANKQLSQ